MLLAGAPNWFMPSCACLSLDGSVLAYGSNDRVQVLDSATATHLATLRTELPAHDRISCVAFSRRQSGLLLVGSQSGRVALWHIVGQRSRVLLSQLVINSGSATATPQQQQQQQQLLISIDCGVDAFVAAVDRGALLIWPASVDLDAVTITHGVSNAVIPEGRPALSSVWRFKRLLLLGAHLVANELLSVVASSTAERGVVAVGTTTGRVFVVDCCAANGDGALLATLQPHQGRVESLQFQPLLHARSHLLFASGGADGKIVVCAQDVMSPTRACSIAARLAPAAELEPSAQVRDWHAVAWLPSESGVLVASDRTGQLFRWRLAERRCEKLPAVHRLAVFGILFGSASTVQDQCSVVRMVTHGLDRVVAFWDARDWSVTTSTSGLSGHCVALAMCAGRSSHLICAIGDGALRVWDVAAARREAQYQQRLALALASPPATIEATLDVLLAPRGEMCRVAVLFRGFDRAVLSAMACHPVWRGLVAIGRADGVVMLYNVDDEEVVSTFAARHASAVRQLSWRQRRVSGASADVDDADAQEEPVRAEDFALYSLSDKALLEHDLTRVRAERTDVMPRLTKLNGLAIHCAQWNRAGNSIALGHDAGVVSVVHDADEFDCAPMQHAASGGMDGSAVCCVQWLTLDRDDDRVAADSTLLAAGTARGQVRVYRADLAARRLRLVAVLGAHKDAVRCLAWRAQLPARLVSGAEDGTAQVLDVAAAIDEQAELLASVERGDADFDASAAHFDAERRAFVANFRGHSGRVLSAFWSLVDDDLIFTGGSDLTVRMWRPSAQADRSGAGARQAKRKN
jgi:WD40 repeat protein